MTKPATQPQKDERGGDPDLDLVRDVQLNRGEVLIWPSAHGRVFGFLPENKMN